MILRDVDEVYTPRVTKVYDGMGLSKEELELKRRTCIVDGNEHDETTEHEHEHEKEKVNERMVKVKQRHFQQLLVRGDNVVMVWRAGAERSVWPKTMMSPEKSMYNTNTNTNTNDDNGNNNRVCTAGSLLLALSKRTTEGE